MQELTTALFARADELMKHAPGQVRVRRISHIDEVQLLRAVRDCVTADENEALVQLRLELTERLDGIVLAGERAQPERGGLFNRVLDALDAAKEAISVMRPTTGSAQELPQRLPAPAELVDAAIAWLLSHLCADRLDADLAVLREPWDQATVDPVDPVDL